MSERYNLVLGWDLTCQEPVRRKYYRWMVGYLIFVGLLLMEGAYQISKRFKEVRSASMVMSSFVGTVPTQAMDESILLGDKQELVLNALKSKANPSIPFLPVLFELQSTLPEGVELKSVLMDPDEVELVFKFSPDSEETPESYLSTWRKNKELGSYLETLRVIERTDEVGADEKRWVELSCAAAVK